MVVGSVYIFAGATTPSGFLVCDGAEISRTDYAELFSIIGTTYGSGDGSTTFNLPFLTGKVVMGNSGSYSLGSSGGEENHVLTESETPSHSHEIPQHGHANNITVVTPVLSHTVGQPVFSYNPPSGTRETGTNNTGNTAYSGTSSAAATRSTSVAITAHPTATCTMALSIDDCPASVTSSVGLGTGHDNMQPFITMNYVIYAGE